ncbi:unnamed protein product [Euphydryas editha]|uniref:Peptidase S1 domain-containing protein n=1 Tax=Euphydryas editha TaxID=104508 RepID=A0AAU9TQW6_EUPED|nr:unnamed protein product [Euphydryas editha]
MSILFDHTDTRARIVGGEPADSTPYIVALTHGVYIRNLVCSGSLVTTRYVLTAAHCVEPAVNQGTILNSLRGHVGTNRYASGGTTYSFSEGIIHPNYTRRIIKNDIGFFVTSSDVELTDTVSLVSLTYKFIDAGVRTIVTGWGKTSYNSTVSQVLLQLHAVVVDGKDCVARMARRINIPVDPELEICTYTSERSGTCNGDSGSALMDAKTNKQIGTVSWGIPCGQNAPDMFARISAYRDWIEKTIQNRTESV